MGARTMVLARGRLGTVLGIQYIPIITPRAISGYRIPKEQTIKKVQYRRPPYSHHPDSKISMLEKERNFFILRKWLT